MSWIDNPADSKIIRSSHTNYAPHNVLVLYGGVDITKGIAEDSFLVITPNKPRVSTRVGLDGNVSTAISGDISQTVKMTFFPESRAAKVLTTMYSILSLTGQQVKGQSFIDAALPISITDPSGSILFASPEAIFTEMGERNFGENTGTVEFTFYCPSTASIADNTKDAAVFEEVQKALSKFSF